MKSLRYMLACLLVIIFVIVAGCAPEEGLPKSNDSSDKGGSAATTIDGQTDSKKDEKAVKTVKVYFPNEDGTKLIAKEKPAVTGTDKYTAAIKALLQGSKDKGVVMIVPQGTELQSVKVDKNIAYVSFNGAMVKKFNGGSTGELLLISSIVNTLTEFPEIKAVQILIDGKNIETLAGHLDLSEPLKRFSMN